MRPSYSIETMSVRQSHVQQDDIDSTFRKMNHGFAHAHQVRQFEAIWFLLTEHLSEQTGISRVILNKKNLECLVFHGRVSRGNLTTDNQKLSMLFTTSRNPLRSTGLVMSQFAWSK